MGDIDHFGRLTLDDRGTQNAGLAARQLDIEPLLDDVDDLVDHKSHGAALIGEHQQRLRAAALDAHIAIDRDQRHELTAILHDRAVVGRLD